jgi:hypothetical protein
VEAVVEGEEEAAVAVEEVFPREAATNYGSVSRVVKSRRVQQRVHALIMETRALIYMTWLSSAAFSG